jgi:hypothetical protein
MMFVDENVSLSTTSACPPRLTLGSFVLPKFFPTMNNVASSASASTLSMTGAFA